MWRNVDEYVLCRPRKREYSIFRPACGASGKREKFRNPAVRINIYIH